MKRALEEKEIEFFDMPDDVVQVRMDAVTGGLAPDNAANAVSALFRKGKEPKR